MGHNQGCGNVLEIPSAIPAMKHANIPATISAMVPAPGAAEIAEPLSNGMSAKRVRITAPPLELRICCGTHVATLHTRSLAAMQREPKHRGRSGTCQPHQNTAPPIDLRICCGTFVCIRVHPTITYGLRTWIAMPHSVLTFFNLLHDRPHILMDDLQCNILGPPFSTGFQ